MYWRLVLVRYSRARGALSKLIRFGDAIWELGTRLSWRDLPYESGHDEVNLASELLAQATAEPHDKHRMHYH